MAYRESYAGKINRKLNKKLHVVEVASGRQKADLVLKNATYVNVFCNELSHGDIAVASSRAWASTTRAKWRSIWAASSCCPALSMRTST